MNALHRGTWLHRYAVILCVATFLLVIAGGLVTSTGSGLAVPDWPLSFGQVFPRMEGGVLFEHGHRMIATVIGMLTVGLAIFAWRVEPRPWVRRLAWLLVLAVILQGVLGGMTVLLRLPDAVSVAHAGLAQLFFALTAVMATVTSPVYDAPLPVPDQADARPTRALIVATAAAVYIQIIVGAIVRHTGAGLAIPTFPLDPAGRIVPEFTSYLVGWQYAHRVLALVVGIMVIAAAVKVLRRYRGDAYLTGPAVALLVLVVWQIFLGGLTIWTFRAVTPTTAHVASGALLWMVSVLLATRFHRAAR